MTRERTSPKRIQRKRTKGWKMPAAAVYVGRPTEWGNLFKVGEYTVELAAPGVEIRTNAQAVALFREICARRSCGDAGDRRWLAELRDKLRGKDLACWCPLDQPCHADVLLEIANA